MFFEFLAGCADKTSVCKKLINFWKLSACWSFALFLPSFPNSFSGITGQFLSRFLYLAYEKDFFSDSFGKAYLNYLWLTTICILLSKLYNFSISCQSYHLWIFYRVLSLKTKTKFSPVKEKTLFSISNMFCSNVLTNKLYRY